MSTNKYPLSASQVLQFKEQGFLVLDLGVEPSLIDQAVADMSSLYEKQSSATTFKPGTRVQDGWAKSNAVHRLATNPTALACLGQLFSRKPLPFQTLNFPVGTEQKSHADTIHFNSMPSGFMAGIWIALEDACKENGALTYYPSSHLLPEYNMQDLGLGIGYENYKGYETAIEEIIKTHKLTPHYAEIKKGHALIWHANLIHAGSPRINKKTTRHSQVTHYFFSDCKYFTPMSSTPKHVAWRKPNWIPSASQKCWYNRLISG